MTRNVRTYDHFCAVARALEQVGDRWSLLVIRDLLTGAKRFTDLMHRLGGITPKTLSQRLHELDDAGIVTADRQPGRREVWYRLTPAGADLGPVIDGLSWWGLRHAWRWPILANRYTPSTCSAPPPGPSTTLVTTTGQPAGTSASTARTTWPKATATSGHHHRSTGGTGRRHDHRDQPSPDRPHLRRIGRRHRHHRQTRGSPTIPAADRHHGHRRTSRLVREPPERDVHVRVTACAISPWRSADWA